MTNNLARKILKAHLVEPADLPPPGEEIGIRIDQTLTQDATGTMAYLQFEAMGLPRVKTELSVSYVDHNMLQSDFMNADDHRYLQTVAKKIGVHFSRPGNGICHQVHLERFSKPGKTLLGSDSHTPTCGAAGMIAIGAGGLDVAVAMGGGLFYLPMPRVLGLRLTGRLAPWVSGKDVILKVLSILSVKGGVGHIIEYHGPGVRSLSLTDRAVITNMGAELGATTSIFPSDQRTREYFRQQGREADWTELGPDKGAKYDRITYRLHQEHDQRILENLKQYGKRVKVSNPDASGHVLTSFDYLQINLEELEPLVAAPHSPDNVYAVGELSRGPVTVRLTGVPPKLAAEDPEAYPTVLHFADGVPVDQVCVGSCTNGSYRDLMEVAAVLAGRMVAEGVTMTVSPGSRQVLQALADAGALSQLIASGVRIAENSCGPCIGMGLAPGHRQVTVRTFNRNFFGRTGTQSAFSFLVSPQTAAAAALKGKLTDPRELGEYPPIKKPKTFPADDRAILPPASPEEAVHLRGQKGPNIKDVPPANPLPETLAGEILLKVGDHITTDHILPAGAQVLPFRSNIPKISEFVYGQVDGTFPRRALAAGGGFIVGGNNYGQGSSREHAALAPMYLGIKAKIAKNFARIHRANLVNFGIVPLCFADYADYDTLQQGDHIKLPRIRQELAAGGTVTMVVNEQREVKLTHDLSAREVQVVLAGGKLNYTKARATG